MDKNNNSLIANETTDTISRNVANNLKRLLSQHNMTQSELADKTITMPSTISAYCTGKKIPTLEFFISLKNLYNISIDDFLFRDVAVPVTETCDFSKLNEQETYKKYCGSYFVYYFDTSKYKGRDYNLPSDSLLYGVLYIYRDAANLDKPEYSCAAVLGIKDREKVKKLKAEIDSMNKPVSIAEHIEKNYPMTAYFGDFELSDNHAFISLTHGNRDKALAIFHRVNSNKPTYTGGIGTINSISKGREPMPTIQFIGISKKPLALSPEEIHHNLLLNYPNFKANEETEDLIATFKTLYLNQNDISYGLTEVHKSIIIKSNLERYIKKSLERNVFRYGKISGRDDDEWYHTVKGDSDVE